MDEKTFPSKLYVVIVKDYTAGAYGLTKLLCEESQEGVLYDGKPTVVGTYELVRTEKLTKKITTTVEISKEGVQ
jgi:hypothetical protein